MNMLERLVQATETCEEADRFAFLNQNPNRFGELHQLVCDADNRCRDFIRRHGREIIAELQSLRAALADVVDHDFSYLGDEASLADPRSLYNRVKRAREVLAGEPSTLAGHKS